MIPESTRTKGDHAEQVAVDYLAAHQYQILERNSHLRVGEIDIVAKRGNKLVFVEVKSTGPDSEIYIWETLSSLKLHRLQLAINRWLNSHKQQQADWQLDFIGVVNQGDSRFHIEHLPAIGL